MFNWLRRKDTPPKAPEIAKSGGFFTTEHDLRIGQKEVWTHLQARTFQRSVTDDFRAADTGMDANELENNVKRVATLRQENMPAAQVGWYASQSFIGYVCAVRPETADCAERSHRYSVKPASRATCVHRAALHVVDADAPFLPFSQGAP
ncbi:MAG: hypothetical protein WAN92_09225 [Herbaspirillum sp.]